jgi:hypothetical protein
VSDYYSSGDKVQATRDTGGVFGSETTQGQSGTVLNSTGAQLHHVWRSLPGAMG